MGTWFKRLRDALRPRATTTGLSDPTAGQRRPAEVEGQGNTVWTCRACGASAAGSTDEKRRTCRACGTKEEPWAEPMECPRCHARWYPGPDERYVECYRCPPRPAAMAAGRPPAPTVPTVPTAPTRREPPAPSVPNWAAEPARLRRWLHRRVGYGSLRAPYWFITAEESCRYVFEIEPRLRGSVVEDLERAHRRNSSDGARLFDVPLLEPSWRPLMTALLVAKGEPADHEQLRAYQASEWGRPNGESLLAYLLPLPAVSDGRWPYGVVKGLDGLESRQDYVETWWERRAAKLRLLLQVARPQVVVAHGAAAKGILEEVVPPGARWSELELGDRHHTDVAIGRIGGARILFAAMPGPLEPDRGDLGWRALGRWIRANRDRIEWEAAGARDDVELAPPQRAGPPELPRRFVVPPAGRRTAPARTTPRTVDEAVLAEVVARITENTGTPIATSKEVKALLDRMGCEWGEGQRGYGGKLLDEASDDAIRAGLVVKWKRGTARNALVGWSVDESVAEWAADHGWLRWHRGM